MCSCAQPKDVSALLRKYDGSGGLNLIADGNGGLRVGATAAGHHVTSQTPRQSPANSCIPPHAAGAAPAKESVLGRLGVSLGDHVLSLNGRDARHMSVDEAEWLVAQAARPPMYRICVGSDWWPDGKGAAYDGS